VPPIGAPRAPFLPEAADRESWAKEDARNDVARRLRSPAVEQAGPRFRIHILEDASLKVLAYPHRLIHLHTGLPVCVENAAQPATVLGHAMWHGRSVRDKMIGRQVTAVAA
jgi:predicted Zn-dependent protease